MTPQQVLEIAGVEVDDEVPGREARLWAQTELGLAERIVHWHGHDLAWSPDLGCWLVWDGSIWAVDKGAATQKRVVDVLRVKCKEEADLLEGEDAAAFRSWLRKMEAARAIRAGLQLAANMKEVPDDLFDADPWLLSVHNGTLDLRTGELRRHRRADYITWRTEVGYDPKATCPEWDKFVAWFTKGDAALAAYLQQLAGYWLTGRTSEQQIAIFHGDGANGKTTYLETLRRLLGPAACAAPPTLLASTGHDQHPTEIWTLRGRRLVLASESREARVLDDEKIKRLTGNEALSARRMREDFAQFIPTHKLGVALNHIPTITGQDHGIWRRLHLVPCAATVETGKADDSLQDKLAAELPGILAWAVRGCLAWQKVGRLQPTPDMVKALKGLREEMDQITMWLEECCRTGPSYQDTAARIYASYQHWTLARGERPKGARTLAADLRRLGMTAYKNDGTRGWRGLCIKVVENHSDPF
jgi:putative DNA primase/helicase